MSQEAAYEIIKWILIVFAAGFVGYFGRHLGMSIIKKFSKKKERPQIVIHKQESPDKYAAKLAKKKIKLQKKKNKKSLNENNLF